MVASILQAVALIGAFLFCAVTPPQVSPKAYQPDIIATDTLVNYCKVVRAGYFYGQKSTENKSAIDKADVEYFNAIWRESFDVPYYQSGITADEFTTVNKFREGNHNPFPPSARYHERNPDTYILFHIAKEVGKIKSPAYDQCPKCTQESIFKINELLKGAFLHSQVSQMWLGTSTLKTITNVSEITDFWLFLRCMFIDDRINPLQQPMFINLPPVVRTPDTTIIKCHDEIKPKVTVGYRHCEIGGNVDTIGPALVKGLPDCPGAVYRFKFVARDHCNKRDSAYQYFLIKNEPPTATCPKDTIVDCIENLRTYRHLSIESSCALPVKIIPSAARLVAGRHNCPDARYERKYTISDSCGRQVECKQIITIQNNAPVIQCPKDTVVECSKDIKAGNPKYKVSCHKKATFTTSTPQLISGFPDCDGAVYEITYTVQDSCDRKASCKQKFTIRNKGPEIECPPNEEVLCFEAIRVGQPTSLKVSCDLGYDVRISDPSLIYGKHNCTGAIYSVTYVVTDDCGRTDECEQLFTILQPEVSIQCPPDKIVMCTEDITPEKPLIKISCQRSYNVVHSAAVFLSGPGGNCPGTKYGITYTVSDECGVVKECTQTFTIDNPEPEIVCGPEVIVDCEHDPDMMTPVPAVSCDLEYEVTYTEPALVSGIEDCDGSRYKMVFTVTDECGRSSSCEQFFSIRIPATEMTCPPDQTVECSQDIHAGTPVVKTHCDLTYSVTHTGPVLERGKPDCPGAVYKIEYTVTDECKRVSRCTQTFTIDNQPPSITCPPDRIVECEEDIKSEEVMVFTSCGDDDGIVTGPTLISGIPGCPNAVYEMNYSITDNCGRTAECTQRFTISGSDLQVNCPRDTTVKSRSDIRPYAIYAITSCDVDATYEVDGPRLISGADDQPGAVYEIIYTVYDECGQRETCVQRFTIIGIPDNCRELCDCYKELKNVPLDLLKSTDQRFHEDVAALIKKYGCKKLKEWAQQGVVELWNAWATAEILGSEVGIATDIARRGNINIVMQNLENINKLIEVLEEAINGEPKKTLEKIAELIATDGMTYLTGSGTPALVFTSIKTLGEFAQYLNKEILIINIRTIANYADTDPCIFDPDHYLLHYARIREIKPGDPVTWNDIHNPFRIAIYEFAQHRMAETKLPPLNEIWGNQQNINLLRTVTHTMLKEVCQYWCYKLTLKKQVNKLIEEQSLLLRFKAVLSFINNYDCQGEENPCTIPNATLVEVNGKFECQCVNGYKWDPGKIRCLPFTDCFGIANSIEVYRGDSYECDCAEGYEWNAAGTECVLSKPDCASYYPNSYASFNSQANRWECYCISGYEWNTDRTACVLAVPDCNSFYANSHAVLNPQTNVYECHCNQGYEWNAGRTACVLSVPDCNSYYANTVAVWNAASSQYECNCIQGYVWNSSRTACELPVPDCNSYYANTVAVWNAASNQYECNCISGYVWNTSRTGCELAIPDCNAYYPNTVAVLNTTSGQYECNCIQGYVWNVARTGCEASIPDCNAYYPNTTAVWNPTTNQYECNCIQGYVWNAARTGCQPSAPDCNAYYPNTIAVWNAFTNQYECNCYPGYVWNATRTGCVSNAPDCNAYYPNSVAQWNPSSNQFECYCITGYDWNATRTACEATGNRDHVIVNPQQQKTGECNVTYGSGANEPEQYTIDVKRTTGTLQFSFDTYTVKDRIHIYNGGTKVFDTGCVGSSGSQTLTLNGSSIFRIVVDPLCDPNESDTQWSFTLGCPQ